MTVLDASAVLALLQDEAGAATVGDALEGSHLSAANLAEVVGKVVDAGQDPAELRAQLEAAGVVIEPVTAHDAELAGALRGISGGAALSLGDRCCLALTARSIPAVVLTTDRAWSGLDLPIEVRLIRSALRHATCRVGAPAPRVDPGNGPS